MIDIIASVFGIFDGKTRTANSDVDRIVASLSSELRTARTFEAVVPHWNFYEYCHIYSFANGTYPNVLLCFI